MSDMQEKKVAVRAPEPVRLTDEEVKALKSEGASLSREIDKRVAPMLRLNADDLKLRVR